MRHYIIILSVGLIFGACEKAKPVTPPASLNVVNAAMAVSNAKVNTVNVTGYFNELSGVDYGANFVFTIPSGNSPVRITNNADTAKPLYINTITAGSGDIYSLYIAGAAGEDMILLKDTIPGRADSSMGVRVINLIPGSTNIGITLSSSPMTNEFPTINYKSITDFKGYGARAVSPSEYSLQAIDEGGNIVASITLSSATYLNHNLTLVLDGMIGGSGTTTSGLFVVKNY